MSNGNAANTEPWTVLRLLQWTTEHLRKTGSSSPRLDAEILLAEAMRCQRIELYTSFAQEPPEEVKARFREFVKRRAHGEPVAYLVGKKEFYSLSFHVTKDTLIPRGETEHLVIECLDRAKAILAQYYVDQSSSEQIVREETPQKELRIADVCTGTGCIAVSIAKSLPTARVIAIDLSETALAVAKQNVEEHQLADRIELRAGNLLDGVEDNSLDFVVSNPPYITDVEFELLDKSVKNHEPKMALVSGPHGTELIYPLADQALQKLRMGGWFLCEFSPMIAQDVADTLAQNSQWTNLSIVKDLAGHARLVVAQKA